MTNTPHATYQDVIDAPPNMVAELIAGELHLTRRGAPRRAFVRSQLVGALWQCSLEPEGWFIVFMPEVHLGADVLVPELGGWRRGRWPAHAAWAETAPPDWACEVLSSPTDRRQLATKCDIYLAGGLSHLWVVDLEARTLKGFAANDGNWRQLRAFAHDATVALPPFETAPFSLANLWSREDPSARSGF